jgi:zinc protease
VNESTLGGITVDGIAGWHRDRYAPQNSVLAIVGAVEADQIIPWLDQELAEWEASDFVEALPPAPAPATAVRVHLVDRPGSAQTTLVMGNLSIDRAHPDYVDVRVASNLLGGGPASRLFGALRRDDTDAYAAYSAVSALDYAGPWTITSAFRTEATGSVMARIFDELETLWNQPVPEPELNAAKRAVVSGYALSLEDPGSLASYALLGRRHGLGDDYWNTYARRVSEVTAEDVTSVLRQHLNPNALQIVVVGDAAQILPVLESYGPVDVFDVDGNLLD